MAILSRDAFEVLEKCNSSRTVGEANNIVICFDGTGGEPAWAVQDVDERGEIRPFTNGGGLSNICKVHLLAGGTVDNSSSAIEGQTSLYYKGVGTWTDGLAQLRRSAFGAGAMREIYELAYKDLSEIHREGDRVYVFGFSRGAATARLFASYLDKDENRINGVKPDVAFLGVFDTVVQSSDVGDSEQDKRRQARRGVPGSLRHRRPEQRRGGQRGHTHPRRSRDRPRSTTALPPSRPPSIVEAEARAARELSVTVRRLTNDLARCESRVDAVEEGFQKLYSAHLGSVDGLRRCREGVLTQEDVDRLDGDDASHLGRLEDILDPELVKEAREKEDFRRRSLRDREIASKHAELIRSLEEKIETLVRRERSWERTISELQARRDLLERREGA
eukprot:CAMPEP_0172576382 /NCGR_PEP_ID=MMETSP1067-20121228/137693_1 /TAXON_ID=265564 ORGANISM="Thalassiosira punctigera, Strain Tpunct2005C2" /NCGR_SAMPLE_ID=MMETSP1067 /ASSEMBLY_ACC=CAM_ASM_000444 /LENGTH=389 /DNA_ID=CAMNT_0013369049 /DNA_START=69 /DNA_END=1234 /DNA_ORIENTATION=-